MAWLAENWVGLLVVVWLAAPRLGFLLDPQDWSGRK